MKNLSFRRLAVLGIVIAGTLTFPAAVVADTIYNCKLNPNKQQDLVPSELQIVYRGRFDRAAVQMDLGEVSEVVRHVTEIPEVRKASLRLNWQLQNIKVPWRKVKSSINYRAILTKDNTKIRLTNFYSVDSGNTYSASVKGTCKQVK
ncbi:MAG: hypothetical protein ABJO27_01340 [Pseudoruegeria sp.]